MENSIIYIRINDLCYGLFDSIYGTKRKAETTAVLKLGNNFYNRPYYFQIANTEEKKANLST